VDQILKVLIFLCRKKASQQKNKIEFLEINYG
jgi:hypothetical protein